MVNFEVTSSSSFRDFPERSFCDGEVGDGSGVMNAICSQPDVADDVISSYDAETFLEYVYKLCVASFSSLREKLNKPFM